MNAHDTPPPPRPNVPAPEELPPDSEPPTPTSLSGSIPYRRGVFGWIRDYFLGDDPTWLVALVPLCFLSMLLYTRHPGTNFIFDEQEALLANPYVRAVSEPGSKIHWLDAFRRDFWGLTPERTIGSYRPLPNLVWRALWWIGVRDTPFLHHWVNVLLHGVNGALLTVLVFRLTRRRGLSWLAGGFFVAAAVVTEAVSGVVGIADVLGGLGALLALLALLLPMWAMPFCVFGATLVGLYSKESALCLVPLVPFGALMLSQMTHPHRPMRWVRTLLAAVATLAAFILYVELRRRLFPVTTPTELTAEANAHKGLLGRTFAALLRWYAQPGLPRDPLNNPLIEASTPYRVAGALRVYTRGLGQVLFPWTLSGDYSAPQEPIPDRLVFPESVFGGLAMVVPLVVAPVLGLLAWRRFRRTTRRAANATPVSRHLIDDVAAAARRDLRPLAGFAMVWIVVSYFPVSNIPVVLPTVRAERFWYFPVVGSSILLALVAVALVRLFARWHAELVITAALIPLFFLFQGVAARRHALDYTNDLVFWDATRHAVPNSAKAHLNYSVMLGARGDLNGRLVANEVALQLAPKWPMANIYLGDTLCRLDRPTEAIPHYERGFELAPNDMNLIALAIQCLWDKGMLAESSPAHDELQALGEKYPGTWLRYLVEDTITNGEENKGVNPKYRPRGYNEGPKKEE